MVTGRDCSKALHKFTYLSSALIIKFHPYVIKQWISLGLELHLPQITYLCGTVPFRDGCLLTGSVPARGLPVILFIGRLSCRLVTIYVKLFPFFNCPRKQNKK